MKKPEENPHFRTDETSSDLAAKARLCLESAARKLLADQTESGYWEGKLGSSPFASALSVFALALGDRQTFAAQLDQGLAWLQGCQNTDGGWGDTGRSPSNPPATVLTILALKQAGGSQEAQNCLARPGLPGAFRRSGGHRVVLRRGPDLCHPHPNLVFPVRTHGLGYPGRLPL
jgi:hypothetical protein